MLVLADEVDLAGLGLLWSQCIAFAVAPPVFREQAWCGILAIYTEVL